MVLDQTTITAINQSPDKSRYWTLLSKMQNFTLAVIGSGEGLPDTMKDKYKPYPTHQAALDALKSSKVISMENIAFGFNQKDSQSETAVMTAIQSAGSKIVILGDEAYQNPVLFLAAFLMGENVGVGFKDDSFLQSLGARLGISFSWLKSLDFTRALELAQRLAKTTLAAA